MRLSDYEVQIKEKVSANPEDPEIYTLLQGMTDMFLLRKKVCKSPKDAEDLSYVIAGDTFMRIRDGERYGYLLGYLEKIYRSYIRDYYFNSTDILSLDTSDIPHKVFGWATQMHDYNVMNNRLYLEKIGSIVDSVMEDCCKYRIGSKTYLNLKLSALLSLLRDEVSPFHLNPEEAFYLRLILTNVYSRIKEDGFGVNDTMLGGKSSYARSSS